MNNEQWMGEDSKGRDCGLIQSTISVFIWGEQKKTVKNVSHVGRSAGRCDGGSLS
jgi:hypothetical protein